MKANRYRMNRRWCAAFGVAATSMVIACGGGQTVPTDSDETTERPSDRTTETPRAAEPTAEEIEAARIAALGSALEQAAALYEAGDAGDRPYDRIASLLQQALDSDPVQPDVWFNLGLLRIEQGDESGAIEAWERAGEVDATYARGLANIGYLQLRRGNTQEAVRTFEACIARRETEPGCNINLSLLYRSGDVSTSGSVETAAIEKLRLALGGDGRNAAAYANIASIYHEQGRLELARLVCENAIILGLDDAVLHNRLGLIALDQEDVITAYAEFRRAVQADPMYLDAHMNIGAMALSFRDYDAALAAFEVVLEEHPGDDEVRLSYGAALRGVDEFELAQAEYRQVLANDAGNLGALYNLAVLYQEAYGDYAEACRNYGTFLATPGAASSERYEDVERRMGSLYNLAVDLVDFGQMDPAVLEACTR